MANEDKTSGNGKKGSDGRATIFDVAERAGVSFVSVSRVFNEHPNVSSRMKDRVLRAAREAGYQPRLVSRPSVIAVLVKGTDELNGQCDKFQLCAHIHKAAADRNFLMEAIPLDKLQLLTQHCVDGIIQIECPSTSPVSQRELPTIPVVVTASPTFLPNWSSVSVDYVHEGGLGIRPLLLKGHRKVAVLLEDREHQHAVQRMSGIHGALEAKRLGADTITCFSLDTTPIPEVCEAVRLGGHTALLNFSNEHVMELMDHIFNELKWDIPGDLSVVSLDNSRFCEHYHPRICSITQPIADIAHHAVEELVHLIRKTNSHNNLLLKSSFHERSTIRTLSPSRKP